MQNLSLLARQVSVEFGGVHAVREISLEVRPGRILGLIGPNGAGKSTMINALTGYVDYTGTVSIDGDEEISIDRYGPPRRAARGIVRTFQTPRLVHEISLIENVQVGRSATLMRGRWFESFGGPWASKAMAVRHVEVLEILDSLNLSDRRNVPASELSLGEQRMVEIARAYYSGARIILLDEPFAGLSHHEQDVLASVIRDMRSQNWSLLLVEHHLDRVRELADDVLAMDEGRMFAHGSTAEVLDSSAVRTRYLGEAT